jgi:sporulation protein YlmC with PRC-barrel domain
MRQHLLRTIVACAAGLALSTQAQSTTGGSSTDPSSSSGGGPGTYPSASTTPGSSSSGSAAGQSGWAGRNLSATGRMGYQPVRGSQLTGAPVTSTAGTEIGTISDTIINPATGRIEFGVISVSGGGASSASSTTSSTGIGSSSLASGGKQVAVPWMLLRPSPSGAGTSAASSTTSTTGSQQPSFVFAGDTSKLQSAPNFEATTDLSQPTWRQSVFSYFGLTGGSTATGGAETPGGTSGSSSSGTTTPQSSLPNR